MKPSFLISFYDNMSIIHVFNLKKSPGLQRKPLPRSPYRAVQWVGK
jgi:hypothetical protein